MNLTVLLVFGLTCGTQCQYIGLSGSNPCPSGYELHGYSCYRYINMDANWMEALTVCKTMSADLVSIESQEENQYVTDLVRNETRADQTQTTDTLQERIWTSGANFQGEITWVATKQRVIYSSWHRGEPYVTTLRDVFCVMKMGDDWFSDQCKHDRKFVCEKELDGLIVPYYNNDGKQQTTSAEKGTYTESNNALSVG